MDLRPSPEQEQLIGAFASLYAKESPPERVRAAEPLGFDKAMWDRLLETGAVAMAVAEEAGGWGASLLDLELIAEQQGRAIAAAPVIEAQVAARLLSRLGVGVALDGRPLVTLALRPARDGVATLVPAGAVADEAVIAVGDRLLLVPLEGRRTPVENLGGQPLADVHIGDGAATVGTAGPELQTALDEWMVLTAGDDHLRRDQRDPAHHHRPSRPGPSPVKPSGTLSHHRGLG